MADKARQWTDKKLSKMESHISKIYKTAAKDVSKKWNAFMEKAGEKADKLQKKYESAVQSGDKDLIKSTKDELIQYKKYITFQNEIYSNMIKETAGQLAHVNETALAYVNDQMPSIYMNNFNEVKGDADNLGVQFTIVNEATVKRLIADKDLSLLRKRLDIPKDERWNTKQLNSSVLQGILQGESMPDIAKRIFNITNRNEASAIRNARTMVTCAENRGRLDSYKELEDNGLVLKKVWMATPDGRTRDWHVDLDGQEVDLKDDFIDGLGNELEYPGDPGGAPETVYNCRCTMITHITGIKMENGKIKALDYLPTSELHEQQMEAEVERRKEENKQKANNVKTSAYVGQAPKRPWKSDFDNQEDYLKAREQYKIEKEKYDAKQNEVMEEWLNADKKYTTSEQVVEWAKQNNVTVTEEFLQNVDPRLYNDLVETQQEMFNRFPEVKAYQDSYLTWRLDYENTLNYYMEAHAGLRVGGEFHNAESALRTAIDYQASGHTTMGDGTIKTLIRHEYGHEADGYCREKFTTLNSTYEDHISGKEARRMEARNQYNSELIELTKKYGSQYSMTNEAEAFAEGFAEFTSNPNSEYGKAFGSFFERWYYANPVE